MVRLQYPVSIAILSLIYTYIDYQYQLDYSAITLFLLIASTRFLNIKIPYLETVLSILIVLISLQYCLHILVTTTNIYIAFTLLWYAQIDFKKVPQHRYFELKKVDQELSSFIYGLPIQYNNKPIYRYIYDQIIKYKVVKSNQKLENLLNQLTSQYLPVPYHNSMHGLDVAMTFRRFLVEYKSSQMLQLNSQQEIFVLIAAYAHDVGHNGFTNNYHCLMRTELALTYHDKSVLENYHCSLLFKTMRRSQCNILEEFSREKYDSYRKLMIGLILATDNVHHKEHLQKFTEIASKNQPWQLNKAFILQLLLHAADISNPAKPRAPYLRWTTKILEQFYNQGDELKKYGYAIQKIYDRSLCRISDNQIGFINHMVLPFYKIIVVFNSNFKIDIAVIQSNLSFWQTQKQTQSTNKKVIGS